MIGISKSFKDKVQPCTREQLHEALDSPQVAEVCQAIAGALQMYQQGEMTQEDFEATKGRLKKQLPILTLHATFKNGRRKNDEALPSGLSMYDLDHIPNPRAKWEEMESRKEELGIVFAHITPSTEGLRLVFVVPSGMDLAQAQAWMAEQLGDTQYDACVKDYARCSFLVPRAYVLYMDESGLFGSSQITQIITDDNLPSDGIKEENNKNNPCKSVESVVQEAYTQEYEEIPYTVLVQVLEEQMGGVPEHGSRNNFIFAMACHLRYVCNDDPLWIAQVMPTYGEAEDKWMSTIRSACNRNQAKKMPLIIQRTLAICKERLGLATEKHEALTPPEMPKRLPSLIVCS